MVLLNRASREPDDTLLTMLTDVGARIGQHLDHRRVDLELRQQRELLFQSEKLSALGRLVAGVAHEMNNPLGIISSRIELMLGEAEGQGLPAQLLEDLRVIHRNVLRVAGVAQALRSFARQSTGERRPVDLNTVVAETLLLVGKPMSTDNVRITMALDPTLPSLLGDANALQQVLLNLLTNAREALTGGGEISIQTGCDPARPRRLQLIVTDTGPGISPTHLPHLFEPFYTTKPSGNRARPCGELRDRSGPPGDDRRPFHPRPGRDVHPQLPPAGESPRARVRRLHRPRSSAGDAGRPGPRAGVRGPPEEPRGRSDRRPARGVQAAPGGETPPPNPASAPRS